MFETETQTVEWEDLKSARGHSDIEPEEDELDFEEVSRETLDELDKKGWCLWRCQLFGNQVIAVVRDENIFNKQLRFSDPLRVAARYPYFTVDELRSLVHDSDQTIRFIYESKKLTPTKLILDGSDVT